MKVFSLFRSIQGESTRAGLPCVFVRLAGCPLHCVYCDTRAACEAVGTELSVSQIVEKVCALGGTLVEITGGEPLLQVAEVAQLASELGLLGKEVLIETSGAIDVSPVIDLARMIVDLKTPGSGQSSTLFRPNLEVLIDKRHEVKAVVLNKADFDWALALVDSFALWDRAEVLIAPAAGYVEPAVVADWVLSSGRPARLQLQLHKMLWPNSEVER